MDEYDYDRRGRSAGAGRRAGKPRDPEEEDDFDIREKNTAGHGTLQRLDSIQDPEKRYALKEVIGSGVCGDVYEAIDQQAGRQTLSFVPSALNNEFLLIDANPSCRQQKSGDQDTKAYAGDAGLDRRRV